MLSWNPGGLSGENEYYDITSSTIEVCLTYQTTVYEDVVSISEIHNCCEPSKIL